MTIRYAAPEIVFSVASVAAVKGNSMTYQPPTGGWNNPASGPVPGGQPYGRQPVGGYPGQQGGYPGQPQPGGYPGQQMGGYPQQPRAPRPVIVERFLAGPANPQLYTILGGVLAFLGVLLVIFSCLSWATASDEGGTGDYTVKSSVSITGLGSVSLDVDSSFTDSGDVRKTERGIEKDTSAPGVWTLIFGLLLIGSAVPFFFRKITPWGVVAAVLVGFAVMVTASVFFADPVSAVADSDVEGDTSDWGAGYGLWIVFFAALIAFFVAVAALVLLLIPQQLRRAVYGGYPGGYQGGNYQQPGHQQSGYQQTGYQQPDGYQQSGYQQPGYNTGDQGYGYGNQQGGYGQQYPGQNQWPQ